MEVWVLAARERLHARGTGSEDHRASNAFLMTWSDGESEAEENVSLGWVKVKDESVKRGKTNSWEGKGWPRSRKQHLVSIHQLTSFPFTLSVIVVYWLNI
jgi:hypothetical protein